MTECAVICNTTVQLYILCTRLREDGPKQPETCKKVQYEQ